MGYDFTTRVSRKGKGSMKWELMTQIMPDVPDDIVPLSVADMELKNPPEIIQGLVDFLLKDPVLGYTFPTVNYLNTVKEWMWRRHAYAIKTEWVCVTPGVVNAFYAAVHALTQPGDGVIIFRPVYYPFSMAIEMNERHLVNVPLINENNYYTIDFDAFEEAASKAENKLLLFCNPHNPVGRVWTEEELKKLAEICIKHELYVVADEIWADLVMPGHKTIALATVDEDLTPYIITCNAASKTFNLAGMATSNIIIPDENLREQYALALMLMRSNSVNILGFEATRLAYTECDEWLDGLLDLLDHNQKLVYDFFEKSYPQIKANHPEGTYLSWIDFRALGMTNEELERFMQEEALWFTDEGYIFGEEGSGYERINLAAPTSVIEEALDRMDKALKRLK